MLEIMQHPGSSGSQTPCFSLISAHYSSIYIARRTPELESIPLPAINSIIELWESGATLRLGQAVILGIFQRIECPSGTCSPIMRGRDVLLD